MKHQTFWAIRVGKPPNAYFMDNQIFDTREDARRYLANQGEKKHYWHVVKIREVK